MHANDFVVNDSSTREAIEGVAKCLPQLNTEPATALIIKTIYPVDSCTLMVTPEDEKVLRILDLVGEQETNNLKRLFPPVYVIPKKKVVRL